ncbi:MAG: aminotransferase class V-fold PLP-dependent enzyme [Spirochaetia bacterium]|jgi:2-aminoethylphosphonate-pyruvate transaminase|nr:aminotransferase class V-fold PLP-dependent enzyme [Spirochaetia bacterium]
MKPENRPVILLNPGPVTISQRVRASLAREDLCHREPEFAALTLDIKKRIGNVYEGCAADYEAALASGSGTCAVEAMLQSLAPRSGKTLVVANGVYGERMASMLEAQGKPFTLIKGGWPEPVNIAAAEEELKKDGCLTHVAAIHHETTTGRLNDCAALGQLCGKYGKGFFVDAVSSFAGEEIRFADWNVTALAATANKCVHGIPGICFVLARRDLMETGKTQASSLYLDLYKMYKEQKSGFSPFTQATHACVALREALEELEDQGGWKSRRARYLAISRRLRQEFAAMGIERFLPEEAYASYMSSFKLPEGKTYGELHDILKEEGFVIYAGQGGLYHSIFRIANMGDILDSDVDRLIGVFKTVMKG